MVIKRQLKQFELFSGLDEGFVEEISRIGEEVTVPSGEWLFREGEAADALYLIIEGSVVLKFTMNEEKEIYGDLNTLSSGATFGWSALVKPHIFRFGAIANTDVKLIRLNGEGLRALTREYPQQGFLLMQSITETMASRMHDMSEHIPEFSMRMFLSMMFTGLAIATGILVLLIGVAAFYSIANGTTSSIGVLLFCMAFPILFFFIAQSLRTGTQLPSPQVR